MGTRRSSLRVKWELICEMWMEASMANRALSSVVIGVATILPWSNEYLLPLIRYIESTFGPEFRNAVLPSFTPLLLFLFVNVVIFSIWLTSTSGSSASAACAPCIAAESFKDDNERLAIWSVNSNETPQDPAQSVLSILKQTRSPISDRSVILSVSEASSHHCSTDLISAEQRSVSGCPSHKRSTSDHLHQKQNLEQVHNAKPLEAIRRAGKLSSKKAVLPERKASSNDSNSVIPALELCAEEDVKIKVAKRSKTLPQAPDQVIVSDIPVGKANLGTHDDDAAKVGRTHDDAAKYKDGRSLSVKDDYQATRSLVMQKDELNERIEAFFARFREQLRQDSLWRYQ